MSQYGPQIDDIHARYRSRFANFPRITRDPELLESILTDARQLVGTSGLDAEEAKTLETNVDLYEKELQGIRAAQGQGPAAMVIHRLTTWANYTQSRYARHFAGQQRRTRDLGILAQCIDDGERLLKEMEALAKRDATPDLTRGMEITRNNLKTYRTERDRIREERKKVFGADRGTLFARLANDQFGRYRTHFANKSRASRSPRMLVYIVDALQEILDGMEALYEDGFTTEAHTKNIALVKNNLGVYKAERENIARVLGQIPLTQRVGELGGAANEVFKTYRENFAGQNRTTRDLPLLDQQIDLLLAVAHEMDRIDRDHDDDTNASNLALVMDMLHLYHRERNLVAEVQSKKS